MPAMARDVETLEEQLQTQIKFGTMLTQENDTLVKQNNELESLLIAERRAAKNRGDKIVNTASTINTSTLNRRYAALTDENKAAHDKMFSQKNQRFTGHCQHLFIQCS